MTAEKPGDNILVIKLGALGDFVQALGPMAAIRRAHKNDHITLLTTKAFTEFAEYCGYFDDIWLDKRPKTTDLAGWANLRKRLISGNFKRVYDLQNNDRTNLYFRLFPKKKRPEWVGIARGASHRNTSKDRSAGHAFFGHVQTLALAGIDDIEIDKLQWVKEDISDFNLKPPYVLMAPGSAPQHMQKRWSYKYYAAVANMLAQKDIQPVILGTEAESDITGKIKELCPQANNLAGKTSLFQIAALAQKAKAAIGNDTGPMHLIAATGCPCIAIFSGYSNKDKHGPLGEKVKILQQENLDDLDVKTVYMELKKLL